MAVYFTFHIFHNIWGISLIFQSKPPTFETDEEAEEALAAMEEMIDDILDTDLTTSTDVNGDLTSLIAATNVIAGRVSSRPL